MEFQLPRMSMPLAEMLEHDADRIASVSLTDGQTLTLTTDDSRIDLLGPDWMLIRVRYGDEARTVYVPLAAITSVTLR